MQRKRIRQEKAGSAALFPPSSLKDRRDIPVQGDPDESDHEEVRRIVDIEQPLHAGPFAALAVVLGQDRDRQEGEHLQRAVQLIQEDKIDRRID